MKALFLTSFKWILIGGGVLLIGLIIFGMVLVFNWPWWVALCLLLLMAASGIGLFLLRALLMRRREQNFVEEVVSQDKNVLKVMGKHDQEHVSLLMQEWKTGIATLKGSHLKRQGNPLYVLPWYLIVGESGSGKSTSLASARLASPFAEGRGEVETSGTRNCNWWFFEESIVLDTAGRYSVPIDGEKDRQEWQKLLALLVKYRRREPLNGVIVTMAADRLLNESPEDNAEEGRTMRRRIDELMRALGVRVPVYVLITKCDLIEGIDRFSSLLPEASLRQPMGMINRELTSDVATFTAKALAAVTERLRSLRLLLLHQPAARDAGPSLALFPEEFSELRTGLEAFMEGAFRENPYQETPLLRGLFFGSGRQAGTPRSRFGETVEQVAERTELPGTSRGLFLHDIFAKVLPADRRLLFPTRRALQWRSVTGNLGLVSWLLFGVALCGLLSFSFVKNMTTIREVTRQFERTPRLAGDPVTDLLVLDSFRKGILKVEERNSSWWIPRFGLTESLKVERALKDRFCRQFRDGFLDPYDRQLAAGIGGLTAATTDELYAQYVIHLARRINILKASMDGKRLAELRSMPQAASVSFMAESPSSIEARKQFGTLYLHYLAWRSDSPDLPREMTQLQAWLRQIIPYKGQNVGWLIPWVDRYSGVPAVTMAEFWGGSVPAPGERMVPASFTRKGKEQLDGTVTEIAKALGDQRFVTAAGQGLSAGYRTACLASWQSFAAAFPRGCERLHGPREWQQAASKIATDQGPYLALLNRMTQELEVLVGREGAPPFVSQLHALQMARAGGAASGVVTKTAATGKRLLGSLGQRIGSEAVAKNIEAPLAASRAWREYQAALGVIVPAASSRQQAFQLATQTFGEDPATGKSPFYAAWNAAGRLKADIGGTAGDEALWRLVTAPIDFLWTYVRQEAAGQLQSLWEEQVLAATLGMTPQQAGPLLLGPDGLAWRFVKGPAAPFVRGTASGYAPRQAMGGTIPFEGSLFVFLARGAQLQAGTAGRQPNYTVAIKGLPTDADKEAQIKPHGTKLEIQCAGQTQTLVNRNFPIGKTFYWSPDACGDVMLQIEVGDLVLTRRYGGPEAFPDFLKEFSSGSRTFSAREFPGEKDALSRMGISRIRVNYHFIGAGAVMKQGSAMAGATAPRQIARSW